jgi:hypothetical protein
MKRYNYLRHDIVVSDRDVFHWFVSIDNRPASSDKSRKPVTYKRLREVETAAFTAVGGCQ